MGAPWALTSWQPPCGPALSPSGVLDFVLCALRPGEREPEKEEVTGAVKKLWYYLRIDSQQGGGLPNPKTFVIKSPLKITLKST